MFNQSIMSALNAVSATSAPRAPRTPRCPQADRAPRANSSKQGPSPCRNGASCRFLKGGCLGAHSLEDYIDAHKRIGVETWGHPKGLCPCGTVEACTAYFVGAPLGIVCPNRLHRGQLLLTQDGTTFDASMVFDALNVVPSAFYEAPNTYVSNAAKREAEKVAKAEEFVAKMNEVKAKAEADVAEAKAKAAAAQTKANEVIISISEARAIAENATRQNDALEANLAQAQYALASFGIYVPPIMTSCWFCQQGCCDGRNHQ